MERKLSTEPEAIARRLVRLYAQATEQDIAEGIAWYGRAGDTAERMAAQYGVSAEDAAGVIAILSPRNRWALNIANAEALIAWYAVDQSSPLPEVNTFNANRAKAIRWLQGDRSALSGPKVEAFYAAIVGDCERVCVDSWATLAAGLGKVPGTKLPRIAQGYRIAARRLGLAPAHFQAIIWVLIRGSAM
jgi:hypothetical protein